MSINFVKQSENFIDNSNQMTATNHTQKSFCMENLLRSTKKVLKLTKIFNQFLKKNVAFNSYIWESLLSSPLNRYLWPSEKPKVRC